MTRSGRRRKPGESASSEFQLLCVTALRLPADNSVRVSAFVVYAIDLSCSPGFSPSLTPILEVDHREFRGSCLAVLGTKLYVIGGLELSKGPVHWHNEVYIFDIRDAILSPPPLETPPRLQKFSMHQRLDMRGRKHMPRAIVIDDHQIFVYAILVDYVDEREDDECFLPRCAPPSFELLDTRYNSWKQLPEIMDREAMKKKGLLSLSLFNVATARSTVIVSTNVGVYRLRIGASKNPKWVKLELYQIPRPCGVERGHSARSAVIVDKWLLCTPFRVLDLDPKLSRYCGPYWGPYEVEDEDGRGFWFELVDEDDKELCHPLSGELFMRGKHVYVARCGRKGDLGEFFLWIDVVNFATPDPARVKYFGFNVGVHTICVTGCFPLKIGNADN